MVGDLFMARWPYLDALARKAPGWLVRLIALLIGFVGPIGVIVNVVVRPRLSDPQAAPQFDMITG